MTEHEFLKLPKADQAALLAVAQREWQAQGAPVCTPDRTAEASAAVADWMTAVMQQAIQPTDPLDGEEWKGAPSAAERKSYRDDNWK